MHYWRILSACALCAVLSVFFDTAWAQATVGAARAIEGDYVIHDFHFESGETLPELRLHYTTLGKPRRDAQGKVDNGVDRTDRRPGATAQRAFAECHGKGRSSTPTSTTSFCRRIGHGNPSKPATHTHFQYL